MIDLSLSPTTTTMLHRAEDISLTPKFTDPVEIRLIEPDSASVYDFECFAGLWDREFWNLCNLPLNMIRVQPSLQHSMEGSCAFVPCDSILRRIFSLYQCNKKCDVNTRRRFNEIPDISDTVYQATSFRADKRLFTRHPITRVVTEHKYPFTTLPQFTLSVHPCLAHLASMGVTMNSRRPFPLAREIGSFMMWYHFPIPAVPSPCPSLSDGSTASDDSLDTVASMRSRKWYKSDNGASAKARHGRRHPRLVDRSVLGVKQMNAYTLDLPQQERRLLKRSRGTIEDVTQPSNVAKRRVPPSRAAWR